MMPTPVISTARNQTWFSETFFESWGIDSGTSPRMRGKPLNERPLFVWELIRRTGEPHRFLGVVSNLTYWLRELAPKFQIRSKLSG